MGRHFSAGAAHVRGYGCRVEDPEHADAESHRCVTTLESMMGQQYTSTVHVDLVDRVHERSVRASICGFKGLQCVISVSFLEENEIRHTELSANLDDGSVMGMNSHPWWMTEESLARAREFLLSKPFHEQWVSVLANAVDFAFNDPSRTEMTGSECLQRIQRERRLLWAELTIQQHKDAILDRAYNMSIVRLSSQTHPETLARLMVATVFFERGLPCDG